MFNTKNSQRSQPLSVHDHRTAQALALAILTIKAQMNPRNTQEAFRHGE